MKTTHAVPILLAVSCLFAADPAAVKVTKLEAPEKALKFEVVVPAKIDEVWNAFTTREGLITWLWSDVTVDLRDGGDWTVHFPGGATGGGTIVSFIAKRQLVMRAMAPEQFPTVRRERTTATFDFEPLGDSHRRHPLNSRTRRAPETRREESRARKARRGREESLRHNNRLDARTTHDRSSRQSTVPKPYSPPATAPPAP